MNADRVVASAKQQQKKKKETLWTDDLLDEIVSRVSTGDVTGTDRRSPDT